MTANEEISRPVVHSVLKTARVILDHRQALRQALSARLRRIQTAPSRDRQDHLTRMDWDLGLNYHINRQIPATDSELKSGLGDCFLMYVDGLHVPPGDEQRNEAPTMTAPLQLSEIPEIQEPWDVESEQDEVSSAGPIIEEILSSADTPTVVQMAQQALGGLGTRFDFGHGRTSFDGQPRTSDESLAGNEPPREDDQASTEKPSEVTESSQTNDSQGRKNNVELRKGFELSTKNTPAKAKESTIPSQQLTMSLLSTIGPNEEELNSGELPRVGTFAEPNEETEKGEEIGRAARKAKPSFGEQNGSLATAKSNHSPADITLLRGAGTLGKETAAAHGSVRQESRTVDKEEVDKLQLHCGRMLSDRLQVALQLQQVGRLTPKGTLSAQRMLRRKCSTEGMYELCKEHLQQSCDLLRLGTTTSSIKELTALFKKWLEQATSCGKRTYEQDKATKRKSLQQSSAAEQRQKRRKRVHQNDRWGCIFSARILEKLESWSLAAKGEDDRKELVNEIRAR